MGRSSSSHLSHPVLASPAPSPFDLAPIWELATALAGKTSAIFSTLATTVARLTQAQADLHFFVGAIPPAIAEQDHLLPVADGSYRYGTLAVHAHPQHVYLPALPLQHAQVLADATGITMKVLEGTMQAQFHQRHVSLSAFEP